MPLLLEYNNGSVLDILSSDLSLDEKAKQMEITGLKFRRDVILQDRIDKAEKLVKSAEKGIEDYTKKNPQGKNKEYNKLIRILNDSKKRQEHQVRKAKKEQGDMDANIKKLENE